MTYPLPPISAVSSRSAISNGRFESLHERLDKVQKIAISSFTYLKDATKVFLEDLYSSCFSYRIITKIPFFIFFYGFWTAFGAIDTIYYVGLTIIVLKASKDIIAHLTKTDRLKSFSDYFSLKDKTKALKNVAAGSAIAPLVFFIDRFLIKYLTETLKFFNFNVISENKLIYQKGFVGNFATVYAILIYPVIKEVLFRGYIETYLSENSKKETKTQDFIKTIFKTSFVFGMYHFGPTSGWINIPIIMTNLAVGLIMSLLNNKKNNLWTSTSCNIVYSLILTNHLKNLRFPTPS
ncbi:MAG: hypothetical protein KR126chlam6_01524 [Candidatus Anoxychlamydiales bacterium]|nr:hypothetical protein [Candidatus Anoxychlamydiales bacterium]